MSKGDYKITIGLEIHAELKTVTKMFCNSKNNPDEKRPNVNICPVCMGYPGTLPTINKEAVKSVIKVGLALGGEIANHTEFDRKNYFYPDIPKGYQISQYKYPLVRGGTLNGVAITRVHLEEDTARSSHEKGDYSLVDFNRAGIPLMELVTEPVISSANEASAFAKELQLLLQYLSVAEANMEKGEMRVEANISVSKTDKFGTKVEVKNLNSFKAVEKAIAYEVARHISVLEDGGKIEQETRGWNENKEITFGQRSKEESHDYRYFPDPDLPNLVISEIPDLNPNLLKGELPELPWKKRERYKNVYGIKDSDINLYINNRELADFFEKVLKKILPTEDGSENSASETGQELIQTVSNFVSSDLVGLLKNERGLSFPSPANFSELISMFHTREISSRSAKDILAFMVREDENPKTLMMKHNLQQKSDEADIERIANEVIEQNQKVVEEYKSGKKSSIQFLIGQGMKISNGSANPEVLKSVLIKILS